MPIRPENKARYPKNWQSIRWKILQRANDKCEWCGAENGKPHPVTGSKVVLTIMHLDHTPENCKPDNLRAACQKCHNSYDAEHRTHTRKETRERERDKIQTRLFELTGKESEL